MTEVKTKVIEAIQKLPDDATYDDIMEIVFIQQKIAKGIEQANNGQLIPHEEFQKRLEAHREKRRSEI